MERAQGYDQRVTCDDTACEVATLNHFKIQVVEGVRECLLGMLGHVTYKLTNLLAYVVSPVCWRCDVEAQTRHITDTNSAHLNVRLYRHSFTI
jgi:hypothetical protein